MIAALLARLGLSAVSSKWIGRLLMLLAVPALCAIVYTAGSHAGHARCKQQVQAQALKAAQSAAAELLKMRAENSRLSAEIYAARRSSETKYQVIREAVPHVIKEFADEGRDRCSFDHHFISLWNDATFGGDSSVPESTGDPAASATGSGEAEGQARAGAADVLGNHIDNAESCWQTRQQLNALIQWHREHP